MIYKKIDLDKNKIPIKTLENFFEIGILFGQFERSIIIDDYNLKFVFFNTINFDTYEKRVCICASISSNELTTDSKYQVYIDNLNQLKYLYFKVNENLTYILETVEVPLIENISENSTIMNLIGSGKTTNSILKKIYNKITGKKESLVEQTPQINHIEALTSVINFLNKPVLNLFNKSICQKSTSYEFKYKYLTDNVIRLILDKLNYYGYEELDINYESLINTKHVVKEEDKSELLSSLTITCLTSILENKKDIYKKDTLDKIIKVLT